MKPSDLGHVWKDRKEADNFRLRNYVATSSSYCSEACNRPPPCSSNGIWQAIQVSNWVIVTLIFAYAFIASFHFFTECQTIRNCY